MLVQEYPWFYHIDLLLGSRSIVMPGLRMKPNPDKSCGGLAPNSKSFNFFQMPKPNFYLFLRAKPLVSWFQRHHWFAGFKASPVIPCPRHSRLLLLMPENQGNPLFAHWFYQFVIELPLNKFPTFSKASITNKDYQRTILLSYSHNTLPYLSWILCNTDTKLII